jgi:hypothetical protein
MSVIEQVGFEMSNDAKMPKLAKGSEVAIGALL